MMQTNFQDHLKWFEREFLPSVNRSEGPRVVQEDVQYSFPSSVEIFRPMIQITQMTSVEFGKFVDGQPRAFNSSFKAAFAAQEAQQAKLLNPPAPSKPINTPAPSMQNSFRSAPVAPSSSVPVVNHTSRPVAPAVIPAPVDVDTMADIPDSVLEDMDFEKLLEQAEANFAVPGSSAVKMSHQTSSAVSTTTVANYNSHTLATPRATLPYTSPPSTSMPPPRNMPSTVVPAKVSKLCHCNVECDVVTISTSMARKKSLVCRQLTCTFVEWVSDHQETAIIPAGAGYSTPYPHQSTSNYGGDPAYGTSGVNGGTSYNGGAAGYGGSSAPYSSYGGDTGQPNPVSNGSVSYDNGGGYSSYDQSYSTSNYGATGNDAYRSALAPISPNTSYSTSYDNNNYRTYPAASSLTPSKPIRNPRVEVQKRFGHREFRPGQWDCIEAALQGRDVFCLMPTGGGKSMVYQLPAWCCAGVTVVFSPLISLIQDQVDALNAMGIRAVCLSQSSVGQDYESSEGRMLLQELRSYHNYSSTPIDQLPPAEQTRIQKEDEQRIKMLYVTPEKFSRSQAVRSLLQQLMHHQLLSRFVLDEAHCLSQWGHDFRPDYLRLADIRSLCPTVPIMALTATANQSVVQDIIKSLQMKAPFVHTMSFNRPNLQYKVMQKKGEKHTLDEIANYIVSHMQWTGIIYCLSRKDCETLVDDMVALKPALRGKISFYHADLPVQEKEYRQRQWFKGDIRVLCATIAFGMGINKPDVRYVIHLHMPKSLTNYYQESGRAGRDGLNAECILYYSYKDKSRVLSMLDKSQGSYDGQQRQLVSLMKCLDFCLDEVTCRRQLILAYFGETFDATKCKNTCDTCQAMSVLRQSFSINGIPLSRLIETHDITHIATLAVHLVMVTTGDGPGGGGGGGGGGGNSGYRGGRGGGNQRYQSNRLPKLTASKLAKLLSGSKGKEVNQYLSSLNGLKENLQPLFREQDVYNIHTQYSKEAMEVICHRIIIDGFIREEHVVTNMQGNYGADYLVLGPRAREILDQKQRVYIKFRGSLPTNGYGPNTGITSSVAAKNSKKNSSKSSHSNIVQTNGQLGHGYAQQHNVEDLLSDGPEGDDDEEDPFAQEEERVHGSEVRPATTTTAARAPPAAPSRRGAAAASAAAAAAVTVVDDAATAAVANNVSRKRKTTPSKKQKDPYAYLDASDGDDDVDGAFTSTRQPAMAKVTTRPAPPAAAAAPKHRRVNARDASSDSHNDSDSVDDDGEWGDSEDSAVQRARPPLKKPRTMQPDSVVDLLEDSDAEEVALDPHEVAQRVARRRAAQKEFKAAQRQQRRKSREPARPAAATQSVAGASHAIGTASTTASGAPPGTLMKSSASIYDYGDDAGDDANFFYAAGDDVDEDDAGASNANDVSFSHSSLSNSDQQRQNLSSLSLPGHSTKRALNFDKVGDDGHDEDEDDDADFEQPSRRTSTSRKSLLSASGSKVQPSKKAAAAQQKKSAKGKFRTFLDDDDDEGDEEEADEDEDEQDSDSDDALAHDEDEDDDDDDVAEIALHAFPRRTSAGPARSKAALAPLFTQAGGKKGFKPPYASQYSKSEQRQHEAEEAAALEAQRLDAMGDNGLTGRQQDALRVWLQAYRRRWANYWHHLSDASLEYIVTVSIPQTMDEIAEVPGIGESRAMRDGPELLATLGAFMVAQTPASEKTRLSGLFPVLTHVLPPPGVDEDIIWRDPQSEAAQLKMSSPSARVMPPLPANSTLAAGVAAAAVSSSRLSFPLASATGAPAAMSSLLKSPAGAPVIAPSVVVRDGDTFVEHLDDDDNNNGDGAGAGDNDDDDVMMVDDDFAM